MSDHILFPKSSSLVRFNTTKLLSPFDDQLCAFVDALSHKLMASFRDNYPDLFALGYWFRKAHVQEIKQQFFDRSLSFQVRPAGNVFQISPGNVDTLFLYSGLLALLMGNRVAIRISSKQSDQLDSLIALLNSFIEGTRYQEVSHRLFVFVSDHDSAIISDLSRNCDVRVLWGSDQGIEAIRREGLSAKAKDISFPERVSCCLISAEEVLNTRDLGPLISDFTKDIHSFSQQACSSPKCLIWQGESKIVEKAREKFWSLVNSYTDTNPFTRSPSELMQKKISLQAMALSAPVKIIDEQHAISRAFVDINNINVGLLKMNQGHGLLLETQINELEELTNCLCEHFQTLAYWGFQRVKLLNNLTNSEGVLLNFDRVEVIGKSLEFNIIWDGYDLLHEFCKVIRN